MRQLAAEASRALTRASARRAVALRIRSRFSRDRIFQPHNDTFEDRYPEIFTIIAAARPARVLSFGCSTGSEIVSLRRLLPDAELVGIDASRGNVRHARRRLRRDPRAVAQYGWNVSAHDAESFDAVLAMAVFRHGDLSTATPESCAASIRFDEFSDAVADLVRVLRTGGLLAVEHANFAVEDTRSAHDLEIVSERPEDHRDARTPRYDRDNRLRLPAEPTRAVVFRKRAVTRT